MRFVPETEPKNNNNNKNRSAAASHDKAICIIVNSFLALIIMYTYIPPAIPDGNATIISINYDFDNYADRNFSTKKRVQNEIVTKIRLWN